MARQTERQRSKELEGSKIWRILYWRQVVSAIGLITFAQEGYFLLAVVLGTALEADRKDILPELE